MSFKTGGQLPLTEDCHHYTRLSDVPWDIQKYWHQRHSIFSSYDAGVYMTDDAWFGVTPEPVAWKIAEDLASAIAPRRQPGQKPVVVDLFAGAGGNTIAFALSGHYSHVIAIEQNAATLACAQHNADVYEVGVGPDAATITWVHGDAFAFLAAAAGAGTPSGDPSHIDLQSTVLFASPPWGGVGYRSHAVFDLATMEPYSLPTLHAACSPLAHALYLPRTSDVRQLARLVPPDQGKMHVVQYCMYGASKAMVAYFPAYGGEQRQQQQQQQQPQQEQRRQHLRFD